MACLAHSLFLVLTFASSFALKLSSEQTTDVYQLAYQDLTRRYSKQLTTNMMKLLDVNDSEISDARAAKIATRMHVACNIASTVADAIITEFDEIDLPEPSKQKVPLPFINKTVNARTISRIFGSISKVLALSYKISAAHGINPNITFPATFVPSRLTTWEAISEVIEPALTLGTVVLKFISQCWTTELKAIKYNLLHKQKLTEELAGLIEKAEAAQDADLSTKQRRRLSFRNGYDKQIRIKERRLSEKESILNKATVELIEDHKWCTAEFYKIVSLNTLQTLLVGCEAASKWVMNEEQEKGIATALEDAATKEDPA